MRGFSFGIFERFLRRCGEVWGVFECRKWWWGVGTGVLKGVRDWVWKQVALLAGAVGPRVASAAAQAAVAAIAEDEPGVWEVPFMRRSKVVSGHKKHASQSTQKYGGR